MAALAPRLSALRADPALNSSSLVNTRLVEAGLGINRLAENQYVAVPAAVGDSDGWVTLWGDPQQLIRGGALPARKAVAKTHRHTVRQVDLAVWIKEFISVDDFLFLKLDIEGAEHSVLRRIEEIGAVKLVDALAIECHDQRHECAATLRRVRGWNVTLIHESQYRGVDSATAGETTIDPRCEKSDLRRLGIFKRRREVTTTTPCASAALVKHTHSSCAVVGSAPSMIFLNLGASIDAHEAVFRTNDHAEIVNVGLKTTVRVAGNAQQLGRHRRRAGGALQLVPPGAFSLYPGNLVAPGDEVKCIGDDTMASIYKSAGIVFGRHALSTGALALGIALAVCDSVTVYGFGGLQSYDHVLRDLHHPWVKERVWMQKMIASSVVHDASDKGVHERKCEGAKVLSDATKLLRDGTSYASMHRTAATNVDTLLTHAGELVNEGC